MTYKELTANEKKRFNCHAYCRICKTIIHNNETFEMLKTKTGKFVVYSFFHSDCIIREQESANLLKHGTI